MSEDEKTPPHSAKSQAIDRLTQVSSHLTPSTKMIKANSPKNALRADYSDVLGQINSLRPIAAKPDTANRGYKRQKQAGKLWVRERIERLLDADSFHEIGSVSGSVTWQTVKPTQEKPVAFVPSNNVQGGGRLGGRSILLTADDFSIRSGYADGASGAKTVYVEKLAVALRLPVVKPVDGSSGGGSVTTIRTEGWSYLPYLQSFPHVMQQLNMGIPNLAAVVGPAIGLGAARAVVCNFSVMAANVGALFNAGPQVVASATFEEDLTLQDLGGPMVHCTNGTIDNLAADEPECYNQIRSVLSYLPNSGSEAPPILTCNDP
ncbi:hypothetical protein NLG97_g122 [Lecanicillium saksenae]|uniref:Uncharacterized protein n=1 Tax=Lecanicillium saksenae TaxID=468837 RepID=A0ACC1RBM0_9HYPO|nr:hypothetical protein NLG97_g122 [Lecanicillium saksenae]